MHKDLSVENDMQLEFAALLEQSFAQILKPGDFITGSILSVSGKGLLVDVGWKHDGFVSSQDIERMGITPSEYTAGEEVEVVVVRLEDDNLVLSIAQARQNEDWKRAEELQERDEAFKGLVAAATRAA